MRTGVRGEMGTGRWEEKKEDFHFFTCPSNFHFIK